MKQQQEATSGAAAAAGGGGRGRGSDDGKPEPQFQGLSTDALDALVQQALLKSATSDQLVQVVAWSRCGVCRVFALPRVAESTRA